ncbi:MAG TPA: metallophosphoesterase family protein [Hyphomicrobiaceae bacterium]|nr:metallophosphoesterase family protein [Hyphomicrobiaceae bacterium]
MIDPSCPLLVFGGPYSNLQATIAMRETALMLKVPACNVICTGDVVAYAANPEETADIIRNWGIQVVAGNCEEQLAEGAADCGCGFDAGSACDLLSRGWYPYALERVSLETRSWMGSLPRSLGFTYHGFKFHTLHGGARQTNRFVFASEKEVLADEAGELDADVILAGHAGIPFISRLELDGSSKTWVNAGVIGVPANDGTPDGWYTVVRPEADELRISLKRLAYDHAAAAAAMRRSGHANGYARAIITGIWPSHDILPPQESTATGTRLRQRTVRLERHLAAAVS